MNKLWVRLSIAFTLVTVIGVMVTLAVVSAVRSPILWRTLLDDEIRRSGGLVDTLEAYYGTNGSWDGVTSMLGGETLRPAVATSDALWFADQPPVRLVLADGQGRIVVDTQPGADTEAALSPTQLRDSISLRTGGATVGYLLPELTIFSQDNSVQARVLLRMIELIGLVLVSSSVFGMLMAVGLSRWFTAPLRHLAASARAIGDRQFDQRVTVEGSDEIRDVAVAFNEMSQSLANAEQLRRNLVADVAHELRTPLTVIQGKLYGMLDDVYPLDKDGITRLYDQTRVLNRLVDDLHELAQAESGQLTLHRAPLDMARLVRDVVDSFALAAESKAVAIVAEIAPEVDALDYHADSQRLRQVLYNLVGNALRHTESGGSITISATCEAGALCLSVTDTGEGIPPEDLPNIFERFYRVGMDRSRARGGSGLGLPIARALVEAHGGTVTASSSGVAGEGSRFVVRLPTPLTT